MPSNYRPVTNLPFLAKILETATILIPQLKRDNFFYKSVCKTNFSTQSCLLRYSQICYPKQQIVFLVLLDLSAAFDRVNYLKLKNILKFKINNICINCFAPANCCHQHIKNNLSLSGLFKIA